MIVRVESSINNSGASHAVSATSSDIARGGVVSQFRGRCTRDPFTYPVIGLRLMYL